MSPIPSVSAEHAIWSKDPIWPEAPPDDPVIEVKCWQHCLGRMCPVEHGGGARHGDYGRYQLQLTNHVRALKKSPAASQMSDDR